MKNKLILFLTTVMGAWGTSAIDTQAQVDMFTLPDTVCTYSLVTPRLNDFSGTNFQWKFCPPQFHLAPTGVNMGSDLGIYTVASMDIKKFDDYFGFLVNTYGNLVKWWFKDGINNAPIYNDFGLLDDKLPQTPSGLQIVQDGDMPYVFVIGGSNTTNSKLTRIKFANGINNPISETIDLGNIGGTLQIPRGLFIAKDGDNWVGYTFNRNNNLTRIDFGTSIENNTPTVTELGNLNNDFGLVTSLMGYNDNGNWYLFATDRVKESVVKVSLGNSLLNAPVSNTYGNMSGRIDLPIGYSVIPHCGGYYGYTINRLGSSITKNRYDGNLAADTSEIENLGNAAGMVQPRAISQFILEDGVHYMFVANRDSSVSRIEYAPCTSSNIAGADTKTPPSWKYTQPGTYSVILVVDEGLETMRIDCEEIVVIPSPEVQVSEDALICEGSTIRIEALYQGAYGITWNPNYNITDTTKNIVDVWPTLSTDYYFDINFGTNCVYNDTIKIAVSPIRADAGADRTIPDGHSILIGGPMTSLGSDYSYRWYPSDFLTSVNNQPTATAKPGHSMTYYLEVKNTDGCTLIDSVNVTMGCSEITLPNVFVPNSKNQASATFGLHNLQLVKLNYFRIYDRWGNLVFQTEDPTKKWDGRSTLGLESQSGVYVYEVDAFCISGDRLRKIGNVTLIR